MYKLVILRIHHPLAKMPDKEVILDPGYENTSQAELRALSWLVHRPNDIVMLVDLVVGICKHCSAPLREKEGWVRHRWVHEGGYYACLPDGETQAEPA